MAYQVGQSIGNRAPTVEFRQDNGGTRYSPGLVQTVPVRRYDREGTDWRLFRGGESAFQGISADVPSDFASMNEYMAERTKRGFTRYDHDAGNFGTVMYGRPRSGRAK